MANSTVTLEQVLAQTGAAMGKGTADTLASQMERLAGQMSLLQSVSQAALDSTMKNTAAVVASSGTSAAAAKSSDGGSVARTVFGMLGTGLGLSPLVSGVMKLFGGGGGQETAPALMKFEMPGSRNVNAGVSSGVAGAFGVDYAQGGAVRPVAAAGPQITVNVNAMDSRSFMDRSQDIAMAVRQAMLESSVLNDVVREA